ncbi:unnamed protein product [Coregonus sp. 'balchen']|nr:unnamed protein product [Coregonus sp. 'balchen']
MVIAARCDVKTSHRVVVGEHDMRMSNEAIQIVKPAKVFTHSRWNLSTIKNDLILIKLATPATLSAKLPERQSVPRVPGFLSAKVSPVCLAS